VPSLGIDNDSATDFGTHRESQHQSVAPKNISTTYYGPAGSSGPPKLNTGGANTFRQYQNIRIREGTTSRSRQ